MNLSRKLSRHRTERPGPNQSLVMGILCLNLLSFSGCTNLAQARIPAEKEFTNSIGMKFVRIEPGAFMMGFEGPQLADEVITTREQFTNGDFDEHPKHKVKISKPFQIATCEVTNAQYELFDPDHRKQQVKFGASKGDDEAVTHVSWNQAVAFCKWLSKKEGLTYRLPTEAEWEYSCRAGTDTPYHTGNTLSKAIVEHASLAVGQTQPNAWGVYDMHGNVEEWCRDWYGPYDAGTQTDPVGIIDSDFKVTRGGSRGTALYYLRSANRLGTTSDDYHGLIGFRVVIGQPPKTKPLPLALKQLYQTNVRQQIPADIAKGPDPDKPYFKGPREFVKMPPGNRGPLFEKHAHFTSAVECPNGDLLALWHSCIGESGRELSVAVSRLRYGAEEWERASLFWDAPDRNDHGHTLWFDGKDTIYHFQGLATQIRDVAIAMRTSKDNGVTWSKPRIISNGHGPSRMPIESVIRTSQGDYALICDKGPTMLWISRDRGQSWYMAEGKIKGKHACFLQLNDGRLFALGRERNIDGMMPTSVSSDMGKTWTFYASEFQPVSWGQRSVLLRLKEGPIFFASFGKRMMVTSTAGKQHEISGLFGAASYDDGKTWPNKRLVTDDGPPRQIASLNGHLITMSPHNTESVGYLAVCQTPDGVIHLLTSRQHFAFNLKWLQTRPPEAPTRPPLPVARQLPVKRTLPTTLNAQALKDIGGGNSATMSVTSDNVLKIDTIGKGQNPMGLVDEDELKNINARTGLAIEFKTQILKTAENQRGLDLEIYDGACGRYALTIKENAVYWYEGLILGTASLIFDQFTIVADGLDNTDAMHTYRIAVRPDHVAQIYRDGKLIGVRNYEYRTPRDAYIKFGVGGGTKALVEYAARDLSGPSQPD